MNRFYSLNSNCKGADSTMKTLKELREVLLNDIHKFLLEFGYDNKIYKNSFWKKTLFGREVLFISFINHVNDFDFTLGFGIRFDRVEDLKNEIASFLDEKQKKETVTIGCELGNYLNIGQKRWEVTCQSDVDKTVEEVIKHIKTDAFSFFNKYSNLETIYEIVKRDDRDARLINGTNHYRGMDAVAIAYLLGKTDEIQDIVKLKIDFMRKIGDLNIDYFQKFVDHMYDKYIDE